MFRLVPKKKKTAPETHSSEIVRCLTREGFLCNAACDARYKKRAWWFFTYEQQFILWPENGHCLHRNEVISTLLHIDSTRSTQTSYTYLCPNVIHRCSTQTFYTCIYTEMLHMFYVHSLYLVVSKSYSLHNLIQTFYTYFYPNVKRNVLHTSRQMPKYP